MSKQGSEIVRGDRNILTTDDVVRTTDDVVRTTDDAVRTAGSMPLPLTPAAAAAALEEAFGPLLDAEYVPGKTRFRERLTGRFGISQLEAEQLCDELERTGRLRFVRSDAGVGWHLHVEPSR